MLFRTRSTETIFIGRVHRPARAAARAALRALASDEASLRSLRVALAKEVDGPWDALPDAEVLDRLAALVAQGRLVLLDLRPGPGQVPPLFHHDEPPPASEPPPEDHPSAWVEVSLVDDGDPPAPVPGARYVVELANGAVIEGYLDDQGKARIEGILEGSVKVSFPDYDAADWQPK